MRKELIAVKAFPYAGRRLRAEEAFSASESDARVLVAIGKARYKTRAMRADDYVTKDAAAKVATKSESAKPQSTYVPPVREFKRRNA